MRAKEFLLNKSSDNVLFLNPNTVIVGQEHGKKLKLSSADVKKIKAIADRYGAWYEGNGMDQEFTKGIIDQYQGSWDDDLLSPKITGYPAPFLYVLFSNVKENDTIKGKIGSDPDSTIFDRILNTQPSTNYFPDRKFDAATLKKFLRSVSEGSHDFVQMSQAPATEKNVTKFFTLGERLMFPDNWEEYPYRAGRVAKSVNDLRDKFLASRKSGVYVAGSDHLIAVSKFLDQRTQEVNEDRHPNDRPYGPEIKPTMPAGTVRVDVSDVYDWYKLGMHISDLDGLGKHDFGKGPPSTIFSFGSEEEEHKYIKDLEKTGLTTTDIDPKDPNQPPGIKRQKTDPTFNVNENMDHRKDDQAVPQLKAALLARKEKLQSASDDQVYDIIDKIMTRIAKAHGISGQKLHDMWVAEYDQIPDTWIMNENFADGRVKGKSRPGRVKRAGASCAGSVTDLRARARNASGEKAKMYHWCANMKSGRNK